MSSLCLDDFENVMPHANCQRQGLHTILLKDKPLMMCAYDTS